MVKIVKFQTFHRELEMAVQGMMGAPLNRALAQFAKNALADAIASREASPIYEKWVNGNKGADEFTVKAPGPILYVFSYWEPIIAFAKAYLKERSPKGTRPWPPPKSPGDKDARYADSHIVMVGNQVMGPGATFGPEDEITIVNTQPYSRKIEVGFMKMKVNPGIYEDLRKQIVRRYGGTAGPIEVRTQFILRPGGYVLKGRFRKGYKPFARTKLRADVRKGQPMRYPAITMRMKGIGYGV